MNEQKEENFSHVRREVDKSSEHLKRFHLTCASKTQPETFSFIKPDAVKTRGEKKKFSRAVWQSKQRKTFFFHCLPHKIWMLKNCEELKSK